MKPATSVHNTQVFTRLPNPIEFVCPCATFTKDIESFHQSILIGDTGADAVCFTFASVLIHLSCLGDYRLLGFSKGPLCSKEVARNTTDITLCPRRRLRLLFYVKYFLRNKRGRF